MLKSKLCPVGGGGQLLMPSPNLIKSQIPYACGGGGGVESTFQLLIPSPNLLKSKIPGGGGKGVPDCGRHLVRI